MSCGSNVTEIMKCKALLGGGCPGPQGPQGPQGATGPQGPQGIPGAGVPALIGSFLSNTTQNATTSPRAITYSSRTAGTIDISGTYPSSKILIPVTGTYRIMFSAECHSTGNNYIQIWPVVNGISVPDSNTSSSVSSSAQVCLVVEYFLPLNVNDVVELYMISDSPTNMQIQALPANLSTTPTTPAIPSIITTVMRIQ